jgi:hypothetical protein
LDSDNEASLEKKVGLHLAARLHLDARSDTGVKAATLPSLLP